MGFIVIASSLCCWDAAAHGQYSPLRAVGVTDSLYCYVTRAGIVLKYPSNAQYAMSSICLRNGGVVVQEYIELFPLKLLRVGRQSVLVLPVVISICYTHDVLYLLNDVSRAPLHV